MVAEYPFCFGVCGYLDSKVNISSIQELHEIPLKKVKFYIKDVIDNVKKEERICLRLLRLEI